MKVKVRKTNRGFNHVDLQDKYGSSFYIRQSSADMSDVWLGIEVSKPEDLCRGNNIGDSVFTILIDKKVWKQIKKARKLAKRIEK